MVWRQRQRRPDRCKLPRIAMPAISASAERLYRTVNRKHAAGRAIAFSLPPSNLAEPGPPTLRAAIKKRLQFGRDVSQGRLLRGLEGSISKQPGCATRISLPSPNSSGSRPQRPVPGARLRSSKLSPRKALISHQRNALRGLRVCRAPPAAIGTSVPPASSLWAVASTIHEQIKHDSCQNSAHLSVCSVTIPTSVGERPATPPASAKAFQPFTPCCTHPSYPQVGEA